MKRCGAEQLRLRAKARICLQDDGTVYVAKVVARPPSQRRAPASAGPSLLRPGDEPVNGLDPEGVRRLRGFLRSLAGEGRWGQRLAVLVGSLHAQHLVEDPGVVIQGKRVLHLRYRVPR